AAPALPGLPTALLLALDLVADAAHRLDERAVEATVNLVAQVVDVDIDHVRERVEVVLPDSIDDLRAGERPPGVAHEVLEQGELFRCEFDHLPAAARLMPEEIEREVGNLQDRRRAVRAP